ncbi:MAG: C4-dicarboxylate ABC transporter [Deltaproteobacteria bacterium HGW-Deltaproteobacteria-20]|nr:MAG: C4-dicarboxylate ABC transporter [Deltaproteobacteria bacterium HGW-Deltaproteobacteria-20]
MSLVVVVLIILLALVGMPMFAVMGGLAIAAWLTHPDPSYHFVRFLAPDVLDDRFAGSPILVTIPLFTFIGYLMAESKTPDRIVRASRAFFGWMPGGLAMVCICASAVFTMLTGGSGVTIVAIGGLLYPALRQQKYPEPFSLGLVTTGGSLGLLFPSLPILIYALVAGIDFTMAFRAGILPGVGIMALLGIYAAWVGIRSGVPRDRPRLGEMLSALWLIKWEMLVPVIIFGGLLSGTAGLEESAAVAALYTLLIEVFIYKDLSFKKDLPRVAFVSMSLAGAIIVILSMANALINYVVTEKIPDVVLNFMVSLGMTETWQFLITLNIFLLIIGMVMEGFSAILVAVPLVLPFAARFNLSPFHLAVMFLLNLEIAYCMPPLGLNLFISSFRFNKPVVALYRVVLPFVGVLVIGLLAVMYIPKISTVFVDPKIDQARAEAAQTHTAPREAWLLECVQLDRNNPLPCTDEDRALWGEDGTKRADTPPEPTPEPEADAGEDEAGDDLFKKMMGAGADGGAADAEEEGSAPEGDLFERMMNAGKDGGASDAEPSGAPSTEDDLFKKMMNAGKDGG